MARHPEAAGVVSSLIPAVARAHRSYAGSLLRGLDLSAGQELLLMMLWEQEPRAQAEITRELAVEPPTVAKMLARMEQAGIIARVKSEQDRRVVLVSLTDKGRALEAPVRAAWQELEARTAASLTTDEVDTLVGLLRRVLGSLDDARRNTPGDRAAEDSSLPDATARS